MIELVETLKKGTHEIGMELGYEQVKYFKTFYHMLVERNKNLNLTTIVEEKEFALKHLIDSIICLKSATFIDGMNLLDVGTGAGFPGIPIKICMPELKVTLVESQEKKVRFLKEVITALGLKNIEAIHARAEDLGRKVNYRESYERLIARAVAGLGVLAEYCLPLVKVDGIFMAMKGPKLDEEITMAAKAIKILGGDLEQVVKWKLPIIGDMRNIVLIKKVAKTPRQYPRHHSVLKKKPLK